MYRLLLIVSHLIFPVAFSQDTINNRSGGEDTSGKVMGNELTYPDRLSKEDLDRMNKSSADFFVQYQRQQKARQKKQAMLYIGIGIFFLIILVVGLRRRIKK